MNPSGGVLVRVLLILGGTGVGFLALHEGYSARGQTSFVCAGVVSGSVKSRAKEYSGQGPGVAIGGIGQTRGYRSSPARCPARGPATSGRCRGFFFWSGVVGTRGE
ncbi:unnamed protein product [Pieris macdunnoughi]|uniref:Uncharacterized protein n=1 Tax=Pieris macdunnoughi TaxID=345717 RepID=A0A821P4R7_9NEOP|nr:unnamed protein product [Pieris macdunnoughi]